VVNYPAPKYPHGDMLTVIRHTGTRNWEGDYTSGTTEHQIGPCNLQWDLNHDDASEGLLLELRGQVTAPLGSDVLVSDNIRLSDGRVYVIDGDVKTSPNSFTGWATGVRFRIAKDGANGLRRV
jgi:hypothetical protein